MQISDNSKGVGQLAMKRSSIIYGRKDSLTVCYRSYWGVEV
jgi:hypothetical protein